MFWQTLEESGLCLNLGSLTFSQSRDIVIPMSVDQYENLEILLDYQSPHGQKKKQCKSITKLHGDIKLLNQQKHRLEFVYFVHKGYELLRGGQKEFTDNQKTVLDDIHLLEETIKKDSIDDNYLTDLLTDLTGQVSQAFSRFDWFKRWGIHYLPSITRMYIYI